jgi:DNA-binding MarR family transcriptional regulator
MPQRDQLNEDLLDVMGRLYRFLSREFVGPDSPYSLTPGQLRALKGISDHALPMSEVAQLMGVTRATATVMVGKLVERGLARRLQDPSNLRLVLVRATAPGRKLSQKVHLHSVRRAAHITRHLGRSERAALERSLRRLIDACEVEQ